MPQSYLVTGGTGFVGQQVVQELIEGGKRVVCMCRHGRLLPSAWEGLSVGRVEADFADPASLLAAVREAKCEVIIHLAARYAWWALDSSEFQRENVTAVENMLLACKGSGVKLVHVSTVLAYGRPPGRGLTAETAFDEETEQGPALSQYAATKAAGDAHVLAAMRAGSVEGCIVYLACCIGRDHKLLDPNKDVMRLKDLISGNIPATISSDAVFTYVYVKDAAQAIVRAAEKKGNEGGERYLVGDQRLRTGEFYSLIADISHTQRPKFEVPDLVRTAVSGNLLFDASKSKAELGMVYTPVRFALEEAIAFIRENS